MLPYEKKSLVEAKEVIVEHYLKDSLSALHCWQGLKFEGAVVRGALMIGLRPLGLEDLFFLLFFKDAQHFNDALEHTSMKATFVWFSSFI